MELSELGLSTEQLEVVNKAIQSGADKVRTEYSLKLKTANDEIAKYKPTDKTDAEKALEQKLNELATKEKELLAKENSIKLRDKLTSKGLSGDLAKYLNVGEDADTAIDEFTTMLNSMVLDGTYKPSNHAKNDGITKEKFKEMSYLEKSKLYSTNPELYKKLSSN